MTKNASKKKWKGEIKQASKKERIKKKRKIKISENERKTIERK